MSETEEIKKEETIKEIGTYFKSIKEEEI